MEQFSSKHLLGIRDLKKSDIDMIFSGAENFKKVINRPIKKVPTLRDFTIANAFFENSTRTRLSFELAEKRLSADVVNFNASSSSVKKGETLLDTIQNILAMKVDMVVMRHPHPGAANFLAKRINVSVVNAGDGVHEHPTQALLDAFSIKEKLGTLTGVKITILGDILHSRVALSNIYCLKKMGAEVCLCAPPTLIPPHIESLGVKITYDLKSALQWCDVVNVLRIQKERQQAGYFPGTREYAKFYGLTTDRLKQAGKKLLVLHPGPMNRGVEIESKVADSKDAIILEQVENGVAIRMAVIYLLSSQYKLPSS